MNEALGMLKAARAKIVKPENWGKGMRIHRERFESFCAAEALEEASEYPRDLLEFKRAVRALYCAAGLDSDIDYLHKWNDAPERTHAEVLAAYDLAIATVRL